MSLNTNILLKDGRKVSIVNIRNEIQKSIDLLYKAIATINNLKKNTFEAKQNQEYQESIKNQVQKQYDRLKELKMRINRFYML